jgi:hypothetical protein
VSQRTGNEWKAQPFVFEYFETPDQRWSDKVLLETYDDKVIEQLKEGMEVRCGFGHNVREYQGRTYNEVKLYRIEFQSAQQEATATQQAQPSTAPQAEQSAPSADTTEQEKKDDDLPF